MNISNILTSAITFAHTPLGFAVAGLLGVISLLIMRWAHINIKDLLALKTAVESVLRDPARAELESEAAAAVTRKKAEHIEQYLNVVGNGGSKLKKLLAGIRLFLK